MGVNSARDFVEISIVIRSGLRVSQRVYMVNGCDATSSSYFYAYNGYDLVIGSVPSATVVNLSLPFAMFVCGPSFLLSFLMVHSLTDLRCLNVGFHTLDYCYMYGGTGSANCFSMPNL